MPNHAGLGQREQRRGEVTIDVTADASRPCAGSARGLVEGDQDRIAGGSCGGRRSNEQGRCKEASERDLEPAHGALLMACPAEPAAPLCLPDEWGAIRFRCRDEI